MSGVTSWYEWWWEAQRRCGRVQNTICEFCGGMVGLGKMVVRVDEMYKGPDGPRRLRRTDHFGLA